MSETKLTASQQAVIFDLDGTLVDTLPDLQFALNRVLEEESLQSLEREETRLMIGGGARNLIELAFNKRNVTAEKDRIDAGFERFLTYYGDEPTLRSNTFPGVEDALATLNESNIAMGVCTNKPQAMTEQVISGFDIAHYFGEAVIGGDVLPVRKPEAGHLLAVIERTQRRPEHTFMVGDSETDVGAARNAGIPIVVVDFGYTALQPEELKADAVISHFDDLLPALSSLGLLI
ncbi:MAG: phosphoglycolate phosphatase [Rhodospirillaceae bacterium]|nr:phosphoglycolate phosphatase [Rhodospirillaceae bacterium]|tara:strand:- start:3624 stop:4322 length:699 start_codon:yes stop_codon:yes gene_type:complete